jgi:hypothetical protein
MQVASAILYRRPVNSFAESPRALSEARAILGFLFCLGRSFPRAEKLARIYFVKWLRDGRVFVPPSDASSVSKSDVWHFDENVSLIDAIPTLLEYREFDPASDAHDEHTLAQFCDWVANWQRLDLTGIGNKRLIISIADDFVSAFGLSHIWARMCATDVSVATESQISRDTASTFGRKE